jgi:hypothetical protein
MDERHTVLFLCEMVKTSFRFAGYLSPNFYYCPASGRKSLKVLERLLSDALDLFCHPAFSSRATSPLRFIIERNS